MPIFNFFTSYNFFFSFFRKRKLHWLGLWLLHISNLRLLFHYKLYFHKLPFLKKLKKKIITYAIFSIDSWHFAKCHQIDIYLWNLEKIIIIRLSQSDDVCGLNLFPNCNSIDYDCQILFLLTIKNSIAYRTYASSLKLWWEANFCFFLTFGFIYIYIISVGSMWS